MKCCSFSTLPRKKYNDIIAFLLISLLTISGAIWSSTIGIAIYIDKYYQVTDSSFKATAINAIYYITYFIVSGFCISKTLVKHTIPISLFLLLIGLSIRINCYAKIDVFHLSTESSNNVNNTYNANNTNNISNIINNQTSSNTLFELITHGPTGVIIGNAIVAAAQPFLFVFITVLSKQLSFDNSSNTINDNSNNSNNSNTSNAYNNKYCKITSSFFIILCYTFWYIGFGIGWLGSLWYISSDEDYKTKFGKMNQVYLVLIVLFLMLYIVVTLMKKIHDENCVDIFTYALCTPCGNCIDSSNTQNEEQKEEKENKGYNNSLCNYCNYYHQSENHKRLSNRHFFKAYLALASCIILTTFSYVISNYFEFILEEKGISSEYIYIFSILYLFPCTIFMLFSGYLIKNGKRKRIRKILSILLVFNVISQTMLLYSNAKGFLIFGTLFNGITSTSMNSIILTFISKTLHPKEITHETNIMLSIPNLFTFLILLFVPPLQSLYFIKLIFTIITFFVTFIFIIVMFIK